MFIVSDQFIFDHDSSCESSCNEEGIPFCLSNTTTDPWAEVQATEVI